MFLIGQYTMNLCNSKHIPVHTHTTHTTHSAEGPTYSYCFPCPQLVEKQLLEKQKVELSEDVTTKVDHATEVTEEELVGASSDQLGQEESESKELKDDDEEGDLPEEAVDAEAHKVCDHVMLSPIVCRADRCSILNYVHNTHTLIVLNVHVLRW